MARNYSKLEGRIVEVFGTRTKAAKAFGMTDASLSNKLHGYTMFKLNEIRRACEALGIDRSEIPDYFFPLDVENK